MLGACTPLWNSIYPELQRFFISVEAVAPTMLGFWNVAEWAPTGGPQNYGLLVLQSITGPPSSENPPVFSSPKHLATALLSQDIVTFCPLWEPHFLK